MVISTNRINRRHLLGLIAAGAVASTSQSSVAQGGRDHFLLTGVPGGFGSIMGGIEVYDANLELLGSLAVDDGVVGFDPTGRPGLVMLQSLFGGLLADFFTGDLATISWDTGDPGLLLPVQDFGTQALNPDYLIVQNASFDRVYVVNLETLTGTDITAYVANEAEDMIWAVPDLPAQGSRGGIWTGEKVYTIDFANPGAARALVGDDPDWYSTTLNLSHDGEWGIYTTYDPAKGGEVAHVYLENLESGKYERIAEGDVWSTGTFVPNASDLFLASTPDGLELRRLADPAVADTVIAETSIIKGRLHWLLSGSVLLYGSAADYESPMEWMLVDTMTWDVTELADLTGLIPIWPRLAAPHPEHFLFVKDTWDESSGPVVGLDVTRGETWTVIDDAVVSSFEGVTSSEDGRMQTVTTNEPTPDVLLIDMEARSVVAFAREDRMIPIKAAVSPNGTIVTVQYEDVRADEQALYWASVDSPTDLTQLTESVLLGWC